MAETGKRALQARETKRAIFGCALDLFAKRPYEQVSVKDICDAAGVSIGAFYHHFGGKDDLLDEGYRVFDQQLEQDWGARETAGTLEDIRFLIDHQMRSMEAMGGFAAAQYFKNQLSVDHSYMLDARRVLNIKLVESLQRGVADGSLLGDPDAIAEEILCVTRGIIYDWNLHGHDYDLVARGRHLVDILLEHYRAR